MSHVVALCVFFLRKMFYSQTSLKWLSTFSTISLAFLIASVIPVFLKPFIAISLSSLRVLCRSTIHFTCSGLITESVRETLTSVAVFPVLNCFDTSLARQESYLSEIKDLVVVLTLMSNGWNLLVKLRNNDKFTRIFSTKVFHFVVILSFKRIHDNKRHLLFRVTLFHF